MSWDTYGDHVGAACVGSRLSGGNGRNGGGSREKREDKRAEDGEHREHC